MSLSHEDALELLRVAIATWKHLQTTNKRDTIIRAATETRAYTNRAQPPPDTYRRPDKSWTKLHWPSTLSRPSSGRERVRKRVRGMNDTAAAVRVADGYAIDAD